MIVGIITANSRVTRRVVAVRSSFASAKRRCSWSTRSNARITRIPVSASRSTRLIRSIFVCIRRNIGTAFVTTTPMNAPMIGRITTSSSDSCAFIRSAMKMPPTIMIGAEIITVSASSTSICTCCTSFVVRVIKVGVPNRLTSIWENDWTRRNSAPRTSRPNAIEVFADQ